MAYTIWDHEIQRLASVVKAVGWVVQAERREKTGVTLVIHREFSAELIAAGLKAAVRDKKV